MSELRGTVIFGESWLFYGCRHKEQDFLYRCSYDASLMHWCCLVKQQERPAVYKSLCSVNPRNCLWINTHPCKMAKDQQSNRIYVPSMFFFYFHIHWVQDSWELHSACYYNKLAVDGTVIDVACLILTFDCAFTLNGCRENNAQSVEIRCRACKGRLYFRRVKSLLKVTFE